MRVLTLISLLLISSKFFAQTPDPGKRAFDTICARCHGGDGNGGEMGPPILGRLPRLDDRRVISLIHNGIPGRGMPPSGLDEPTVASLVSYVRSIQNRAEVIATRKVNMVGGGTLEGDILGEGFEDLQLRTADKRVHLLRRSGDRYREVTSQVGWPNYNGDTGGNRFTTLP